MVVYVHLGYGGYNRGGLGQEYGGGYGGKS